MKKNNKQPKCPRCNSTDIKQCELSRPMKRVAVTQYTCKDCGCAWEV